MTVDNRQGGAVATRHLIERGHERIGLVLPVEGSVPSDRRRAGYEDALREAGLPVDEDLVVHTDIDLDHDGYTLFAGYSAMRTLLQRFEGRPDGPTAIFVAADVMAYGALRAVREAGLEAPSDLEVIGFDDIESSAYVGLSTVRQPMYEMGKLATEHLVRRLEDPGADPVHTVFSPDLVLRETTGEAIRELA